MNLTAFHKLLIGLSIALAFAFAHWAFSVYSTVGSAGYLVTAIASLAAGWALAFYLVWFGYKMKRSDLTK